jgi:hypothetical protein
MVRQPPLAEVALAAGAVDLADDPLALPELRPGRDDPDEFRM